MPGSEYLIRQAATLIKFAKVISDPDVAAGLIEKAADLKSKAEEKPEIVRTPPLRD
ncbi:hypothetical protein V1278_001932 [Bradyrhizobium sp. AZCC 1577]|uniref:hypothetical protein n=1 Tax=Bradyrhizobium sp. AZCC 1577 TaxID=3117019 RepID=UPI002FF03861